jgi:adenylate kinase family enzyme
MATRIQIIGSSNSGKSTLGARLADRLQSPLIELDALNWQPDWVSLYEHDREAFGAEVQSKIEGDSWIVDGNYFSVSQDVIWPRVQKIIWLDLPLSTLSRRLLRRSYRRWRTKELLWGTNTESFWPHLALWNRESLLRWLWSNYQPQRKAVLKAMTDERWTHIEFIHLRNQKEIDSL